MFDVAYSPGLLIRPYNCTRTFDLSMRLIGNPPLNTTPLAEEVFYFETHNSLVATSKTVRQAFAPAEKVAPELTGLVPRQPFHGKMISPHGNFFHARNFRIIND